MQVFDQNIQNQKDTLEDSVQADIKSFKALILKFFKKSQPILEKRKIFSKLLLFSLKDFFARKSLKRFIQTSGILLFVLVLFLVGFGIFKSFKEAIKEDKNRKSIGEVSEKSPTPSPYLFYKPSVYAEDPNILKIEEEVKILTSELSGTTLREGELLPPSLDFDVSF